MRVANPPVLLSKASGIATVTLNRPESLNVLSHSMLDALEGAFLEIREDAEVRCVIVTGEGRAFSAGADLRELKSLPSEDALFYARRGQTVVGLLEALPVPSIAQVGGLALGGGCELALAATFRFASTTALIGLPELTLELIPGFGGTQRLPRLVGIQAAKRIVLLGDKMNSETAFQVGLFDKVFLPENLSENTLSAATQLASTAQIALRAASNCIRMSLDMNFEAGMAHEAETFSEVFQTAERVEGLRAFFEKRTPQFRTTKNEGLPL